jgi:type II secretion system protein I
LGPKNLQFETRPAAWRRAGATGAFTLLEVILALAILGGAIAVLGEAARHTMRNVTVARLLTRAELLCESKMAEILAGLTPPEPAQGTADNDEPDSGDPPWQYSIEIDQVDSLGLIAVRVTMSQDLPADSHPVEFTLVRWMTSPDALSALSSQSSQSSSSAQPSSPSQPSSSSSSPSTAPSTGGSS